jgi:hypothetical protein
MGRIVNQHTAFASTGPLRWGGGVLLASAAVLVGLLVRQAHEPALYVAPSAYLLIITALCGAGLLVATVLAVTGWLSFP